MQRCKLTSKLGSVGSANGFGKLFSMDGQSSSCEGNADFGAEGVVLVLDVALGIPNNFDQSDVNESAPETESPGESSSIRSEL